MKAGISRLLAVVLMACMLVSLPANSMTAAAKTVKLSRTSVTLKVKNSVQLRARVNGKTVKAKWSSANRKVAAVTSTGKVVAKAPGTTTITARIGTVKRTCKVTVRSKLFPKKTATMRSC